jgi:hypothetical protein
MSPMDPQTLQIFAYIAAAVGLGQFVGGVVLGRPADNSKQLVSASNSPDASKQLVSCVLQGGGIGLMAWAAICYFANAYDWAFMAGLGAFAVGSSSGSFAGMRAMKARGTSP